MDDQNKLNIQIGTSQNTDGIYIEITENGSYILHGKPKICLLYTSDAADE